MNRVTNILDAASFLRKIEEIEKTGVDPEVIREINRFRSRFNGRNYNKTVTILADTLAEPEELEAAFPILYQQLETHRKALEVQLAPVLAGFHKIQEVDLPPGFKARPKQIRYTGKLAEYFAPGKSFRRSGFVKYPTGMGKTILIGLTVRSVIHHAKASALVLSPRNTINKQNKDKIKALQEADVSVKDVSEIKKGEKADVTIATYAMGAREATKIDDEAKLANHYDVIFLDECHRAFGEAMLEFLRKKYPNSVLIGLSATPYLGSGLDPRKTRSAFEYFEGEIDSITLREACEDEDLTPIRAMKIQVKGEDLEGKKTDEEINENLNTEARTDIAIKIVKNHIPAGEQGIVFCAGVQHAKDTAKKMKLAGIKAEYVDGDMSKAEIEGILEDLRIGKIQFVCNSDLLIEGFDNDLLKHAIILRATQSLWIYEQMIGRVCRLNEADKNKIATIWDVVGQHSGQCTLQGLSRFYGELKNKYLNGEILFGSDEVKKRHKLEIEKKKGEKDFGTYGEIADVIQIEEVAKVRIPRDWIYYSNPDYIKKDIENFMKRYGILYAGSLITASFENNEILCESGETETFGSYIRTAIRAFKRAMGVEFGKKEMLKKLFEIAGIQLKPELDEEYLKDSENIRKDLLKFAAAARVAVPDLIMNSHKNVDAECVCGWKSLSSYCDRAGQIFNIESKARVLEILKTKGGFEGKTIVDDLFTDPTKLRTELEKFAKAAGVTLNELSPTYHRNVSVKIATNEVVSLGLFLNRSGIDESKSKALNTMLEIVGEDTSKRRGRFNEVDDSKSEKKYAYFADPQNVAGSLKTFAGVAGCDLKDLKLNSSTADLEVQTGDGEIYTFKEWLMGVKPNYPAVDTLQALLALLIDKTLIERRSKEIQKLEKMDEDYFDDETNIEKDFKAFAVSGGMPSHLNVSFSDYHLKLKTKCQNGETITLEEYINRYSRLSKKPPRLAFNELKEKIGRKRR